MRKAISSFVCLGMLLAGTGCVLQVPVARTAVVEEPVAEPVAQPAAETVVAPAEPVIVAPGVVAFTEVPPVADRVYIYDPGYYPGTYVWNDGYVYDGYYYPRDVYVNRVVTENIRQNRFMDVRQNKVAAAKVSRAEAARIAKSGNGGAHTANKAATSAKPATAKPAAKPAAPAAQKPKPAPAPAPAHSGGGNKK